VGKPSVQNRLRDLESQYLAHSMALRALVVRTLPNAADRRTTRDVLCNALENLYGDKDITTSAHDVLQRAIHEIEGIFESDQASGEHDPSRPQG
jgi:hypothetical protein